MDSALRSGRTRLELDGRHHSKTFGCMCVRGVDLVPGVSGSNIVKGHARNQRLLQSRYRSSVLASGLVKVPCRDDGY